MSSAFFRRPGDDSSESSCQSDDLEYGEHSQEGTEEVVQANAELTATESVSSKGHFSAADSQDDAGLASIEQYRNLLLASLLEDYSRTRAAEALNASNPGSNYHRTSAETQPLAKRLFAETSQTLALNGILPASAVADDLGHARRRFLTALDGLGVHNLQNHERVPNYRQQHLSTAENSLAISRVANWDPNQFSNLSLNVNRSAISTLRPGLQLSNPPRRSHYESSFQQLKLLGKGGFGRVYHAYNLFDQKEYAVKKIPLSPKLSQRYRELGHQELETVLREVQALARLEHQNVVRYHATWIEEPRISLNPYLGSEVRLGLPSPKLLADRSANSLTQDQHDVVTATTDLESSPGIVFGSDSVSDGRAHKAENNLMTWSSNRNLWQTSSVHESDIFTDGLARSARCDDSARDDSVYVLYVQMSLYPMTLTEYLSPRSPDSTSGLASPSLRHCFHLVPALRILLGILCGLQYIHAKGLIHRDIKPSNIFISNLATDTLSPLGEGYQDVGSCPGCVDPRRRFVNPRIGDFGLVAEVARSTGAETNNDPFGDFRAVGTEYYRPPAWRDPKGKNQVNIVDEKTDVYALGVILVEMLWLCTTSTERLHVLRDLQKGHLPHGLTANIDSEGHEPGVGSKVEECIKGMIEHDPRRRLGCTEVRKKVEQILAQCRVAKAGDDADVNLGFRRAWTLEVESTKGSSDSR